MTQRILFACLLVVLTGGAGTAARADCSPLELLQFYSAAARSNFSAIDGGDKGAGVLTGDSRARALKANALCPNKVFFEDMPAKAGYHAYRIVEFDATLAGTSDDVPAKVVDQFSSVLAKQNFGAKPYAKRLDDGISVTWESPDNRWVVVRFYHSDSAESAGKTPFSVDISHDY